ncbi:MAG: AAA family ATPase [Thermofilum sp.]
MPVLLKRVEIEGFRYFAQKVSLELDQGLTVIAGPVGSGKSSLLSAVSYALYGMEPGLRRRFYAKSDLINARRDKARIEVVLKHGDSVLSIVREISREHKEYAKLVLPDGRVVRGSGAVREYVESLLGLDFEEFYRTVHLSFATLLLLAYGTPEARSRVLDRLLGLDSVAGLVKSIPVRRVESELEKLRGLLSAAEENLRKLELQYESTSKELARLRSQRDELLGKLSAIKVELEKLEGAKNEFEKLQASIAEVSQILQKLKQKIGKGGFDEYTLASLADDLKHRLLRAAELLPVPASVKEKLEKVDPASMNLKRVYEALKEAHSAIVDEFDRGLREVEAGKAVEVNECELRLKQVEEMLVNLEVQVREFEDLSERRERILSEVGSEDKLRSEISKLEREYERLKELVLEGRAAGILRRRIVEELRLRGETRCPVCGSELDKSSVEKLEPRIRESAAEQESELRSKEEKIQRLKRVLSELQEIKARLIELEEPVSRYEELESLREKLSKECEEVREELERARQEYKAIEFQLSRAGNLLLQLREGVEKLDAAREIESLEKTLEDKRLQLEQLLPQKRRYDELERQFRDLREQLRGIEAKIEALESMPLKQQLEEAEREYRELSENLKRVENLRKNLLAVRKAMLRALADLREERVRKISDTMNLLLKSIYPYSDIEEVKLEVEEVRGLRSTFKVAVKVGGEWTPFTARLSDGQKTVVILALLTSIFKLLPHNVGFMLLDEPLPNVDERVKLTYMQNIFKTAGVNQVVITTQAERLAETLPEARVVRTIELVSSAGQAP